MDKHVEVLADLQGISAAPITPQMFAAAGIEHMEKYGEWYFILLWNLMAVSFGKAFEYCHSVWLYIHVLIFIPLTQHVVGSTKDHFAKIAEKNHRHSANNE